MIVEVYKCPNCGKEVHVSDIDYRSKSAPRHKILVLCLDCNNAPVMELQRTEIIDAVGERTAVII